MNSNEKANIDKRINLHLNDLGDDLYEADTKKTRDSTTEMSRRVHNPTFCKKEIIKRAKINPDMQVHTNGTITTKNLKSLSSLFHAVTHNEDKLFDNMKLDTMKRKMENDDTSADQKIKKTKLNTTPPPFEHNVSQKFSQGTTTTTVKIISRTK